MKDHRSNSNSALTDKGNERGEVRRPWSRPVVTRFAIERTLGGSGSTTDGAAGRSNY